MLIFYRTKVRGGVEGGEQQRLRLTGTTKDVTPLAKPFSSRPTYSIQIFWAEMISVKPRTKGIAQSIRLSFLPTRSTMQPPRIPPAAAPSVTTDYKTKGNSF